MVQVLDCNVTGEWHSELGSQLQLRADGPEVRGVYRTAVESARGAAGLNHEAKVVGWISDGSQPTIAFSVLWVKGNALRQLCLVFQNTKKQTNNQYRDSHRVLHDQAEEPLLWKNANDARVLIFNNVLSKNGSPCS